MARFLGLVSGRAKTEATRLGSANSGMRTECRGWDSGVTVTATAVGDSDIFQIYATGGSNNNSGKYIGRVVDSDNGPVFEPAQAVTPDLIAESEQSAGFEEWDAS